jgi:hypothetical protein
MAINTYSEKFLSLIREPVLIECNWAVGSTGAVGTLQGGGVSSVERLGVGVYRINLDRAFNRLLDVVANVQAGITGGAVNDGSLIATTLYQIITVGTSNFTASGAKVNQVGEAFVATGVGGAGSGTVKAVAQSQAVSLQLCSDIQAACSHVVIQAVDDAGAAVEVEAGSKIRVMILARKSSIPGQGES